MLQAFWEKERVKLECVKLKYEIKGKDFINAGYASSEMKKALSRVVADSRAVKRAAIAMYEAEINAVIHASEGVAEVFIYKDHVEIVITDKGPGIPDVDLAMQEGWSTAPDTAREMGFGAGMGLPNIKKNSDYMNLETKVGQGTKVTIGINYSVIT